MQNSRDKYNSVFNMLRGFCEGCEGRPRLYVEGCGVAWPCALLLRVVAYVHGATLATLATLASI